MRITHLNMSNSVLLDTYSIVRGENIEASLLSNSALKGRTLNEALTFGFV